MSAKPNLPKMPYLNTKVPAEQTQMEITLLLKKYGVKNIQWTDMGGQLVLKFMHTIDVKGVQKEVAYEFKPPALQVKKKGWNQKLSRYQDMYVPHVAAAMRLLFWYLESLLKATTWGLESMEMLMATHILFPLPDGTEMTLGEVLKKRLEQAALGGIEKLALEEQKPL